MALNRARQADAECIYRVFQRPPEGRVSQRDSVLDAAAGADRALRVAGRLQRITPAFETRLADAVRLCRDLEPAPGSGAALRQRLRASSRRSHSPTGQLQPPERTQDWIKLGGNVKSLLLIRMKRGVRLIDQDKLGAEQDQIGKNLDDLKNTCSSCFK